MKLEKQINLRRAVVKKELVDLTGDTQSALILNQFIIEETIVKEGKLSEKPNIRFESGWICKDMNEIKDEAMLTCSTITIGRRLSKLVESGWLNRRTNPHLKLDRRYQYKVNTYKILEDLSKLGYTLQDYAEDLNYLTSLINADEVSKLQNEVSKLQSTKTDTEPPEVTDEVSKLQNDALSTLTVQSTLQDIYNNIYNIYNKHVVKNNINNNTTVQSTLEGTQSKNNVVEIENFKKTKTEKENVQSKNAVSESWDKNLNKPIYPCRTAENQIKQNSSVESSEGAVKKDPPANSSQKSKAESDSSAIKELVEKYQGMVNPADICRILGPNPTDKEIKKMKDALEYIDLQYIKKGRKIINMGGLLRCAFIENYKAQSVDPIAIKHQRRLEQERAEWEKEMSKPPAGKKSVEKGLQMMRDILFGSQGSGFANTPAYS